MFGQAIPLASKTQIARNYWANVGLWLELLATLCEQDDIGQTLVLLLAQS